MEPATVEERVGIVTGAGRGIGRAVALAMGRKGMKVSLAARTPAELEAVREEIGRVGGLAEVFPTDMRHEDQVKRLVERTVHVFGRLDVVVNNAGIGRFGPLEHTSTEQWDLMMSVNARGPFLLCREALPHLKRQPVSHIVNIGSVVSVKGYVNQAAYGASKHALLGMSKALAREVQESNVRVHAVCPGGVDTGLVGDARPDLDRSVLMSPEEIAGAVMTIIDMKGNAVIDEIHLRRAASTPWA